MKFAALRQEFRPMLALAAPLAAAELAWIAMSVVDTIMLGPLGPAAMGASAIGGTIFYSVAICGTCLLLGMDTLVAQAAGAGDLVDCRRTLASGLWLSAMLAPLAMCGTLATIPAMRAFGANPQVYEQFVPFLGTLAWSIVPLFFHACFRRYLQALEVVKPVTFAIVTANLVNFAGNWILIYGHWGLPAMGVRGSALSTCFARAYMALVLLIACARHEAFARIAWRPEWNRISRLLSLGIPAALQFALEGGVFTLVTAFAARLEAAALAAHGIALNVVTTTYMVPLGISSAAAVRVGNAVGRRDGRGADASGSAALLLGALFMGAAGVVLFTVPESIVRIFSSDPSVIHIGIGMLAIAAFFELGDGAQVIATGALRGLGETRIPMYTHLAFYWGVGLPAAYLFCFRFGWGAPGLWLGLCAALVLIGATLLFAWRRQVRRFQKDQSKLT
jgi:MATE family multidrug resistance protein